MDASEKQQEEAFVKKYGALKPKRNLIAKDRKHFDSADWAMDKDYLATVREPKATEHEAAQ